MTQAQMEGLRKAILAYRQDGDDGHLLDWIQLAETLRAWRAAGLAGAYTHCLPRSPAPDANE
jgi:hypothetical protein